MFAARAEKTTIISAIFVQKQYVVTVFLPCVLRKMCSEDENKTKPYGRKKTSTVNTEIEDDSPT